MKIEISSGEFEIRSLSRETVKKLLEREKEAKGSPEATQELQDWVMRQAYGQTAKQLERSNRDYLEAYNATVAYSLGLGEEAIKNSSWSGNGSRTRTE